MKKLSNLFLILLAISICACSNEENSKNDTEPDPLINEGTFFCGADFINSEFNNSSNSKITSVISLHTKWTNEARIRVKFLNGDTKTQEKTKQYINQWAQYINPRIEFVDLSQFAEIIIAFNWNGDTISWSKIGSGSVNYYSQNTPSMNISWLNPDVSSDTFRGIVLHEFGHALGLFHEHQSPDTTINWNKPYVYKYFIDNYGYSPERVDNNFFNKIRETGNGYSNYDPYSIMHYPIPKSFTLDGYSVNGATDLSLMDINYIRRMYPKSSKLYPNQILENGESITSPNGKYSLTVELQRLKIYDNEKPSGLLYSITLRPSSGLSLAKFKFENSTLVFYNLKEQRTIMGESSLNAEYAIITDSGDVQLIKNGQAIWSLFNGRL